MLETVVQFVAEVVTTVLADYGLRELTAPARIEVEVRRSTEGDVFWRVTDAQVLLPVGMRGVIERYDP